MTRTQEKPDLLIEFLGTLKILLMRGQFVYNSYLSNQKRLLDAIILKNNNERIRELILSKAHLLPQEQLSNAIDLVFHIDIWDVLWVDLYESTTFKLEDEFVFENTVTFPSQSVTSLMSLYLELNRND